MADPIINTILVAAHITMRLIFGETCVQHTKHYARVWKLYVRIYVLYIYVA